MRDYKINPDKKYTKNIIEGLLKKDGYCPCKIEKTEENLCPCDEFVKEGKCHCNLFIAK